ncbi:MAG: T9SS type A sorting domain-containing protein, partial [Candidatus Zixiibacteriota bacterium]
DSIMAYTDIGGVLPVNFYNDEELKGIEVTLTYNSPDIVIDSFSFIGGRLEPVPNIGLGYSLYDDSTIIVIYGFPQSTDLIPVGNGLMGNLYFTFNDGITPQLVTIDTITFIDDYFREHATTFQDTSSSDEPFIPYVIEGYLDIQESPPSMDSVWVENVTGNPGQQITVDVNLYNELDLQEVSVALDYADNSLLRFDSVSIIDTRGSTAIKNVQSNSSSHLLWVVLNFGDATPLTSGTGPVFTMFYTIESLTRDTVLYIDSTTYFTAGNETYLLLTTANGGGKISPIFNYGEVQVDVITAVEDITDDRQLPISYELTQNYPNPFNPSTQIEFSLPEAGYVQLEVFNILGRKVRQLVNQRLSAGVHRVTFDGRSESNQPLASGIYLYRLTTDNFTESKKMILLK